MIRSPWLTLIYQLSDYVQNSTKITAPKKNKRKKQNSNLNQKKDTKKKKKRNIMFKKWTFIVTKTDVTIL